MPGEGPTPTWTYANMNYMVTIMGSDGETWTATYGELVDAGWLLPLMSEQEILNSIPDLQLRLAALDDGGGGSGGSGGRSGGGGGGAVGPVYVKPDERVIREAVKGTLAALAGTVDPGQLDKLTKLYMDEHARSWAVRETEQIDPMESVKASIRSTSEYKAIHQLRPESTDEYDWITTRQGALTRAGVTAITAEQLGVAQATAGSSTQETVTAGNISTFNQSGQQLDELKNRIRSATCGALQLA